MITNFLDRLLSILSYIVFVFIDIYINLRIFFRGTSSNKKLNFKEYFVSIENEDHTICEIGDDQATSDKTLLLIGGIPTDPIESMSWLAHELHKIDSTLRIIIFNMPYYDEHFDIEYSDEFAISNGESFITRKEIDFSTHKIDPKFSHVNQSKTVNLLMNKMEIDSALFIDGKDVEKNFEYALRNVPKTDFLPISGLNVYDIIRRNFLVISEKALLGINERFKNV